MASGTKINAFRADVYNGKHQLDGVAHSFKAALTLTAPTSASAVFGDLAEIAAGGGYNAGGMAITVNSSVQGAGLYTWKIASITLTAAGAPIASFRYFVPYNVTQATPLKPIVGGFWDLGSTIVLSDGDSITFNVSGTNGLIQHT